MLGRVLIKRIGARTDAELRREQTGFRKGRTTTEQILVLRNIIEQVVKWNSSLYMYLCLEDYAKAFDSINRNILWKIMSTLTAHVQSVVDGNGRTDWLRVKSGVKQECNVRVRVLVVFLLVTG